MAELYHLNIRGLKIFNSDKINKVCYILEKVSQVLFLNIQETHLRDNSEIPRKFDRFTHLYHQISSHTVDTDKGAGILMFVNKTEEIVEVNNCIPGRLLFVRTQNKVSKNYYNILSFYGKSHASLIEIQNYLQIVYDKITEVNLANSIIVGDFNFVTSTMDRNTNIFTAADKMYTKDWLKLEIDLGLVDAFRVTNPKRRLYTFTHTNGKSKSRIDRMYLSGDVQGKIESSVVDNCFCSDHKIVRLRLASEINVGPGQWVLNNLYLQNTAYIDSIKNVIKEYSNNKTDFKDAKANWEFLKQNIAAESKTFGKKQLKMTKNSTV